MSLWQLALLALGVIALAGAGREVFGAFILKPGVYGTLQPVMQAAERAVLLTWEELGLGQPVITSIEDGEHMPGSRHYEGLAFDVRLNDIPGDLHLRIRNRVADLAGPDFDVIHEYHGRPADHLHVEWDV